ncbi:MAG: ATPase [Phycisphaerae bacterium]|nr:ATPase [Phycisphaerae bacterium]
MLDVIARLRDNIARIYMGEPDAIDRVIACLIARGHALIEDVPGVGKTVLASAVAKSVDCQFSRIQLTPDLLPSDILGVTVFDREGSRFVFKPGPIFANVILADEINRTPPRTQTALLEAMSDGSVSIDGEVRVLEQPFIVLATQNPREFEGTYPLPENQLDRFLMRLSLGYPSARNEMELLDVRPAQTLLSELTPVLSRQDVVDLQRSVDSVRMAPAVREHIVTFARATREHPDLRVGLSPRGSLALAQTARATALMAGRDHVIAEDVIDNITAVCAHRVIPAASADLGSFDTAAEVLMDVLQTVDAPV